MHCAHVEYVNACVNDASWCTRWWCIMMHALMMHYNVRVDARVNARVNAYAMQFAWMRMRCSLRECACDAVCVNAHAMQFTWMRMQCSLRKCVYDAVCVFAKWVKSAKPLLSNPNNHCRFQMIMLAKTWFKLINQLWVSSGIISLDLADEIFCWCIRTFFNYKGRQVMFNATLQLYNRNLLFP